MPFIATPPCPPPLLPPLTRSNPLSLSNAAAQERHTWKRYLHGIRQSVPLDGPPSLRGVDCVPCGDAPPGRAVTPGELCLGVKTPSEPEASEGLRGSSWPGCQQHGEGWGDPGLQQLRTAPWPRPVLSAPLWAEENPATTLFQDPQNLLIAQRRGSGDLWTPKVECKVECLHLSRKRDWSLHPCSDGPVVPRT